eukprot:Colp12_sorted_trinity150504_noHs@27457
MKLRQLESAMEDVEVFSDPKIALEQYPTLPHIAARSLYTIHTVYDDIESKSIADLGVGCGALSIGAMLLGSSYNVGFDIDEDALEIAQRNCDDFELDMDFIHIDVQDSDAFAGFHKKFDTVLLNPPFGTKNNAGIDMVFLQRAIELSRNAVYSLHKTSTRKHIEKKAKGWGMKMEVVAELRFNIPNMYSFHKKQSADVEVDLLRFTFAPVKASA